MKEEMGRKREEEEERKTETETEGEMREGTKERKKTGTGKITQQIQPYPHPLCDLVLMPLILTMAKTT